MILRILRMILPRRVFEIYHRVLASAAAFWYGYPTRTMVVIGVTGTNGKTSTSILLAKTLEHLGIVSGCTTTALIKVGSIEEQNKRKMTMPGRFALQKELRRMKDAGCTHVVIETSSQGLIQSRHIGIDYDIAIFTNLTPEHLEAHGGFENYKKAKKILFNRVRDLPQKTINGVVVPKAVILNADSEHSVFYEVPPIPSYWYSLDAKKGLYPIEISATSEGSKVVFDKCILHLPLVGRFQVANALAVIQACLVLGFSFEAICGALEKVKSLPGRFQRIDAGQTFDVIIDYAYEPVALELLYQTIQSIKRGRIIHVLGSCGGGRDAARRPVMGALAAKNADIVIVTNEDPYDDNPQDIIDAVAAGARNAGAIENVSLFIVRDRHDAIEKAILLAQDSDMVLLTGKGNEAWICGPHGTKQPWNEEQVARNAIAKRVH